MRRSIAVFIMLLAGMFMLMITKSIQRDGGGFEAQPPMDAVFSEAIVLPNVNENLALPPDGSFNVQIQSVEVTQGVRGDIPFRIAPYDDLILPGYSAFHIADRRTVVRAYPWVSVGDNAVVPPLSAQLWGYRDGVLLPGSPLSPVNALLVDIAPERELDILRSDASLSWNFLLPPDWTASGLDKKPFSLRFLVEVNPSGPNHTAECQDCSSDNRVLLDGQTFVHVPPIKIKPYLVDHTLATTNGEEVTFPGPTPEEFYAALDILHKLLPIGDGESGIIVLESEYVSWEGPTKFNGKHTFAEAMIQQHLPDGTYKENSDGIYHVFLFNSSLEYRHQVDSIIEGGKIGLAWIGGSYVQSSARGYELVHELTHAIGLSHAGNKHGEGTHNPDYPDECGRVESNAYGFDVTSLQAIQPDFDKHKTHDFMSYARYFDGANPKWVSIYTWKTIAQLLGGPDL